MTGVKVKVLSSYGWRDNQLKQKLPGTTQFKSSSQHVEYVNEQAQKRVLVCYNSTDCLSQLRNCVHFMSHVSDQF